MAAVLFATLFGCHYARRATHREEKPRAEAHDLQVQTEDAYHKALRGEIHDALTEAERIHATWNRLRPDAIRRGLPPRTVESMDVATTKLQQWDRQATDALPLAREVNEVSAHFDELLPLYGAKEPGEVYRLKYLGRELELDARQSEFPKATEHLGAIKQTWSTLRDRAVTEGGASQAEELDRTVKEAEHAIASRDTEGLLAAAHRELVLIVQIEKVLAKPPKS